MRLLWRARCRRCAKKCVSIYCRMSALKEGEFHLKQGVGGIVDIEFMVQYAVLAWSHRVPELARWSDNVRILETLGREGLFERQECEALTQAYLAYRSAAHQLSLQQQPGIAPAGSFCGRAGRRQRQVAAIVCALHQLTLRMNKQE